MAVSCLEINGAQLRGLVSVAMQKRDEDHDRRLGNVLKGVTLNDAADIQAIFLEIQNASEETLSQVLRLAHMKLLKIDIETMRVAKEKQLRAQIEQIQREGRERLQRMTEEERRRMFLDESLLNDDSESDHDDSSSCQDE